MLIQYIELKKNLTRKLELNELKHKLKKNAPEVFPARRGYRVARYSGKIISDLIYTTIYNFWQLKKNAPELTGAITIY